LNTARSNRSTGRLLRPFVGLGDATPVTQLASTGVDKLRSTATGSLPDTGN
jgi:hypothetical protein